MSSRGIRFVVFLALLSVSPSSSFPSCADQDELHLRRHESTASFCLNFCYGQSPDWRPDKREPAEELSLFLSFAFGLHMTDSLADLVLVLDF